MSRYRSVVRIHRLNLTLGIIAWLGIAQFIVSIFWAISLFHDDSFTEHSLSDLGRLQVDGRDNRAAASVFNRVDARLHALSRLAS